MPDMLSRRQFLHLPIFVGARRWLQPDTELPIADTIRQNLEDIIGDLSMGVDFRCIQISDDYEELFRTGVRTNWLFPVASCFKAFAALWYFINTPQDEWENDEFSIVHQMVVLSDNYATGVLLDEVGRRVSGPDNAIVKFNDFLRVDIGMIGGLHTWNWEGSPTAGFSDPRYAPSIERAVWVDDVPYQVDNVFRPTDLARGHDFITRGEFFTHSDEMREAMRATKDLLAIPAESYQSPIERVWADGYAGKDGILPASDVPTGRVVNDAGTIIVDDHIYIIGFMSAGESESTAVNVLGEVLNQIEIYENA
jgi:hypothetical protein